MEEPVLAVEHLRTEFNTAAGVVRAVDDVSFTVARGQIMGLVQRPAAAAQEQGEAQQKAALAEIEKNVEAYAKYVQLTKVADAIKKLDNVQQVTPARHWLARRMMFGHR